MQQTKSWAVKDYINPKLHFLFDHNFLVNYHSFFFMGSKRSGKSYTIARLIIYLMITYNINVLAVRKVADNLKASVFTDLVQAIYEMHLEQAFKITDSPMEITYLPTSNKVLFKGMNAGKDSDNLGGQRLGSFSYKFKSQYFACWVEEAYEFSDEDLSFIIGSLPGAKIAWVFRTLNSWDNQKTITAYIEKQLNPDKKTMLRDHIKVAKFLNQKECFISINYLLNEHNLTPVQINEMRRIEENQPKLAPAFCWGMIGIAGEMTYPTISAEHKIKVMPNQQFIFRGGIDYGPKRDDTVATLVQLPQDRRSAYITHTYKYSNWGASTKKEVDDFVKDIFEFYMQLSLKYPQMVHSGVKVYVDRANTAFYQVLKNRSKTIMFNNRPLSTWLKFKESKKPRINKRVEAENYLLANNQLFWWVPDTLPLPNLESYFNKNNDNFIEWWTSKKELRERFTQTDGRLAQWIRMDGNDNCINAVEYALSKDWEKLTKGSYIKWSITDTDD